jgi:hypothetical protein
MPSRWRRRVADQYLSDPYDRPVKVRGLLLGALVAVVAGALARAAVQLQRRRRLQAFTDSRDTGGVAAVDAKGRVVEWWPGHPNLGDDARPSIQS